MRITTNASDLLHHTYSVFPVRNEEKFSKSIIRKSSTGSIRNERTAQHEHARFAFFLDERVLEEAFFGVVVA
jgi:hypothetical protein